MSSCPARPHFSRILESETVPVCNEEIALDALLALTFRDLSLSLPTKNQTGVRVCHREE